MPNTDQAQADPTDDTTVMDPLDAMDSQSIGTSALSAYEAEVASLSIADLPGEPEEEAPEGEDANTEEQSTDDAGEEANEESSEEDAQEDEEPAPSNRFRIRAKDEVEAEALALRKRHPDLSLKECIAKAELILGVEAVSGETNEGAPQQGETVASISEQIKELQRQRREAIAEMEFESQAELTDKIDELRDKRDELKLVESQAQAVAEAQGQAAYDAEYKESMRKAVSHYPDATNPDSPLTKRIVALDAAMLEMGDPLYHSPDKPFLLAKAAARDLGVIMTKPGATAPVNSSRSPKSPMQPAPGNRGTTASPPQRTEDAILSASSLDEYERLVGRG